MTFGATEIIIVVAVIILFFGARKIPELARGIGQGINEFQRVSKKSKNEDEDADGNKK
ncbi:Sec-independent protein translocase subunit TatA/TatB [Fodinibius sediminis]|uniref:Sec-independent protein translocase protein TatA n=1 Tax=Fodinibius sediminis TaxID=1214077 RepID=A0A521DWD1_9BACT|nr:twin-arginine translocase TatA/TatE family subunit [Fodinibius sediminis]SMO76044.1 sec-independent protein translocase protein TatA [Fodinibius sediminis]